MRQLVITKCDSLIYYKVRQLVITKCDSYFITKYDKCYYKVRQVLQSAIVLLQSATGITKCDGYYKVRQNTLHLEHFHVEKNKWVPACSINLQIEEKPSSSGAFIDAFTAICSDAGLSGGWVVKKNTSLH